jgi:Protein of unknown function (DUF3563)
MTDKTLINVSDRSLPSQSRDYESADALATPEFASFAGRDPRELTHEDFMAIEREARALRARVAGLMFRRMGRAIERAVWRARQRDIEKYLAKSSDLADLERRMREIEQGRGTGLGSLSY